MSGGVTGYYDRLEPHERLIAAIAAAARTDDQEIDRLIGSCPRHAYVQPDWTFTQCMRAADYITTALAFELGPHLGALNALDSACDYLEVRSRRYVEALRCTSDAAFWQGVRWAWARSGRDDDPPDPNELTDRPLPDIDTATTDRISAVTVAALRHIATDLATFSRAILDGFGQWASEEGLEPLALVAAFAGELNPQLEAARPLLDAAEPDPEVAGQYADLCRALWANR